MVESFNIGMKAHDDYARAQKQLEAYKDVYKISPERAGIIASHTFVQQLTPEIPHIVRLMRLDQRILWAFFDLFDYFKKERHKRRLKSRYLIPSFGAPENLDAEMQKLIGFLEEHKEETQSFEEGQTILEFLTSVKETNLMIDEVHARIKQFVQG